MKNIFYFTLKFVLDMFKFLFWLSGQVRKRLDKKAEVGLKIYDVTNWETITITNHILPDISRSKGNQTIAFCHLIDYNKRNIFLEKSWTKCDAETGPRPFLKIQYWAYLCITSLKFIKIVFIVCPKSRTTKIYWN